MAQKKPPSEPVKAEKLRIKQAPAIDPRFQLLLTLIAIQKNARHKRKRAELEFLMVNQTFNLVPYRHCLYWRWDGETVSIEAASGLVQLDPNGPYAIWIKNFITKMLKERVLPRQKEKAGEESYVSILPLGAGDCSGADLDDWKKWSSAHAMLFSLKNHDGDIRYGLWIDRQEEFNEAERAFLEDLSDGYAHAMHHFDSDGSDEKRKLHWKSLLSLSKSNVKRVMIALLIIMCLPVRTSVTAPAEIVARSPYVVSVPFDGVIENVEVAPNQLVKKGDLLVRMDSTVLKNRSEMTIREMETAEIAFNKTEREALVDRSKLVDINILKSQVEAKNSERNFAADLLLRSEIRAERDGVVIFADANSMRGRPARTGEQIMLLADPQDSELLIRVPVDSMIAINEKIPATFFLNVSPLGFKKASYDSISYQATPDPDGLLTYKIRARFEKGGDMPRVGWTGTGKVYGDRTIMAYNVLRRPLVTLRRKIGL